jgi:protein O-mannosyl-transferase
MQYNHGVDRATIQRIVCPALLLVASLAAYAPVFQGEFQFDDFATILDNPHLARWQTFVGHVGHMVRPALYGTYLVDKALYGDAATGYHLLNLLLHLGTGVLLFRILMRAVTEEGRHIPFWTALLFLIHPIQTETVVYISGRASGLMAFFYLLALLFFIKSNEAISAPLLARLYRLGAMASFVLSLGSKETAATFPLALLLWDVLVAGLNGSALRTVFFARHLPFWFVLLLGAFWAWTHPRYSTLMAFSVQFRPFWDNLLSQVHAAAYSLMLFFTPWNQNFDHDLPVFRAVMQWPLPLDLLLFLGIAAAAWLAVRSLPLVTFGLGWFVLQLLPIALIPRVDLLSERNLYLALIGVVLTAVVLGSKVLRWLMRVSLPPLVLRVGGRGVSLTLVLLLGFCTYQRTLLYRDQVLLWADTVQKSPNKARPHNNLGHALALRGEWEKAIEEFRIAARLDPEYALAQHNLRDAYLHHVGRR